MNAILAFLESLLTILGSVGAIYSGWSWWKQRRRERLLDQPVSIRLWNCSESEEPFKVLDIKPARRDISRNEVLGLVGMIPIKGGKRFTCAYSAKQEFIDQLDRAFEGSADKIDLFFTPEEQAAFILDASD